MDPFCYLCFMYVMMSRLFFAAAWSPALLCVIFSCIFVTFQYSVLGKVWYLIVSIPDRCLLPYFYNVVISLVSIFANMRVFWVVYNSLLAYTSIYLYSASMKSYQYRNFDISKNIYYSSLATVMFKILDNDKLVWRDKTVTRALEIWCT